MGKAQQTIVRKVFIASTKAVDGQPGVFEAVISTNSMDRDNEVIQGEAWKRRISSFNAHNILLSSHDYLSLSSQIGEVPAIKISDEGFTAKLRYYIGEGNPEADWAANLASKGKAAYSVGFIPFEWKDGDGEISPRRTYTDVELLEISHVVVGSNRDALVTARSKGLDAPLQEFVDDLLKQWPEDADGWLEMGIPVRGAAAPSPIPNPTSSVITSAPDVHVPGGAPALVKGPISYASAHPNGTSKADEGEGWDAGVELREAEGASQLRRMHAWVDSEADPETTGAYKLPHHTADGVLVWRGVAAAMGALMGARGGVDVPEGDMAGCHAHLGKHYAEFDKKPPEMKFLELAYRRWKQYANATLNYLEVSSKWWEEFDYQDPRVTPDSVLKPFANESACRLRDPADFQEDSFRRVSRESGGKSYGVIMGRLKGETTMTEQSYRYPVSDWTVGEARKHCKEHDGILFEPPKSAPSKGRATHGDVGDELDYLRVLLDGKPLPETLKPIAKEVIEILMRETGYDSAVEDKSGAVLNRKNKEALKQAQDLIQQVLDSAEPQQEGIDPDRMAALVGESLARKLGIGG